MSASGRPPAARVRVYLPTYRRNDLLPRALESLRAQTVKDWVCELHNDDPGDKFPAEFVAGLADPRITVHNHPRNLGGTASFNLFYGTTSEPFSSVLEDDNWWEPTFLEEMLRVADANPDVTIFWSNMHLWKEELDGSFTDTGRFVRPDTAGPATRIGWGQPRQISGALFSNGAALIRARPGSSYVTPSVPFAAIEPFRERLFPHPLMHVPLPLANYSITLTSERSKNHGEWAVVQSMLAAAYFKHADRDDAFTARIWGDARSAQPPATGALFFASFLDPACAPIRRHAQPIDWLRLLRGALRRPWIPWQVLSARRVHCDWWAFLDLHTTERFAEARRSKSSQEAGATSDRALSPVR